jgi:GNAT superfamily N-acetyltransferase
MESVGSCKKLYIADLVVRDDVRRMGVATQLIAYIEKHAMLNQFKELYLHVETTNFKARKMYEKLGFVEVPSTDVTNAFTEFRLQKPSSLFVLLWKEIIH